MRTFSDTMRNKLVNSLYHAEYDVLIIGGGITGCGIALDSVTRGLKTLLVDMQDFSSGTSSRSTKLVHGGLRYLKQFEVKLVAEVGKERAIVYENAPHVTHPEKMLLPIYKGGTFGKLSTSLGLMMYDFLAGVKKEERRKMLSKKETIVKEPLLNEENLLGSGYYVEYRTDDARLTIEVAKKAFEKGADLINYAKVESFCYDNAKVTGAQIKDQLTGELYQVKAKKVINASGPWVDQLIQKDKKIENKKLQLTKGIHIVIDSSIFPLRQAVYFDTPDRRMIFAIPRDGKTYVGTTDTVYSSDLCNPEIEQKDKEYLLNSIHYMFPKVKVGLEHIESCWAGVRPLIYEEGKGPSEISRKDEIWASETGLITIAGGKLTGYRKMAEHVVDRILHQFEAEGYKSYIPSVTKNLKLSGGDFSHPSDFIKFVPMKSYELMQTGIEVVDAMKIASLYGTNVDQLLNEANKMEDTNGFSKGLKLMLDYSMQHEMTITPVDFFMRRTGALFFHIDWVNKYKEEAITYMANHFGWSDDLTDRYRKELEQRIAEAV